MNTEKIEKLKKGLTNSQIPETLREKIRQQIKILEAEDLKESTPKSVQVEHEKIIEKEIEKEIEIAKEEAKKEEKQQEIEKVTRAKKVKKESTSTKPTAMALAKQIRKDGESWKDAVKRASSEMKKETTATKKAIVQTKKSTITEMQKLLRFVKRRKELKGITRTNVSRDASRTAKPRGVRTVTHSGETSNQYGTYDNHLGRKYTENRDRHSDRLAPNYPKDAPKLAYGGAIKNEYKGKTPEQIWNSLSIEQREHFLHDHNQLIVYYVSTDPKVKSGTLISDLYSPFKSKSLNYSKLNKYVKQVFEEHVKTGEYANGGLINDVKKGDVIKITFDTSIKKDSSAILKLKNRNKVRNGTIDKITFENVNNPQGVKFYAYKRGNEKWFFAIGDMGISNVKITTEQFNNGGLMDIDNGAGYMNQVYAGGGDFMSGAYAEEGAEVTYIRNKDGIRVKSVAMPEKELTEAEWLAKHNESREARTYAVGGGIFADTFTGETGTHYTGLVGETNAMSSGEMFENGGGVGLKGNQSRIDMNHNGKIDADDFTILRNSMNGAWRNEHKHVNSTSRKNGKVIDYEVRYARKNNPSRTGYKDKKFYDGGKIGDKFEGIPNGKFENDWELYKPRKSYVLDENNKILSIHETPIDAIKERNKTTNNYKVHFQPLQYGTGGFVDWHKYPTKKVRGIYQVKGKNIDLVVPIVFFEREDDENYSIYPADEYKDIFRSIKVKSTALNSIDKGHSVKGQLNDGTKVTIKMVLSSFDKGGYITFKRKAKSIAKRFVGKSVEPKYQKEYGKVYDKDEALEVGNKIAGKMRAMGIEKKAFGDFLGKAKNIVKKNNYKNLDEKQVMLKNGDFVQVLDQSDDKLYVIDVSKLGTGAMPRFVNITEVDESSFMAGGTIKNGYFKNEIDNDYIDKINDYYNLWDSIKTEKDSENFKKIKPPMFGSYGTTDVIEQIKHFEKIQIPFYANEVNRKQFKKEVSKIIEIFKNKKTYSKGTIIKNTNKTNRGGAMQLAKEIRKEGEKWTDAVKRANEQLKKSN